MTMRRRVNPFISEQVSTICEKLKSNKTGDTLSRSENTTLVTKEEAAAIATVLAGWEIPPGYIRQLTRGKNPRLFPTKAVGNSYLYKVADIVKVHFTKSHKRAEPAS
jgi:hypothetical protein